MIIRAKCTESVKAKRDMEKLVKFLGCESFLHFCDTRNLEDVMFLIKKNLFDTMITATFASPKSKEDFISLRIFMVKNNIKLEEFIEDRDYYIRILLIEKGLFIEKFKNDKDHRVRAMLAKNGYYPEFFINDPVESVQHYARAAMRKRNNI